MSPTATTERRSRGYVEQREDCHRRAAIYAGIDLLAGKERELREAVPTPNLRKRLLRDRHDLDPPWPEEAASLLNETADDPAGCLFSWLTTVTGSRLCAIRGRRGKDTESRQGRRLALDGQAVQVLRAHRDRREHL